MLVFHRCFLLFSERKLDKELLFISCQSALVTHFFGWPGRSCHQVLGDQIDPVTKNGWQELLGHPERWVTRAHWLFRISSFMQFPPTVIVLFYDLLCQLQWPPAVHLSHNYCNKFEDHNLNLDMDYQTRLISDMPHLKSDLSCI